MKRMIVFIILVLLFDFMIFRIILVRKADKEIVDWNINVAEQLSNLNLDSILLYNQTLYARDESFHEIEENKKLLLQYEIANYDIILMPMIVSKLVIICQTHSLKVLNDNFVYEFKCNEQIQSITYPKQEGNSLIFYIIKFNSNKIIDRVPLSERKWFIQKIIFTEGKFTEQTISDLDLPDSYFIKHLKSEVNFFAYLNDFFYIVLTEKNGKSAIYQFSKDGKIIKDVYNGYIIIPNEFSDKYLWYIQKDNQNKNYLMKNDVVVDKMSQYITQGHFIKESIIEFFNYNTSDFGNFDFINGAYAPFYSSEIYMLEDKKFLNVYFKDYINKYSIFKDKIRKDNILVIF